MKTLTKIALTFVMLATAATSHAGWVSGYYRSNGTYVAPYYRSDYGTLGGYSGSSSSSRDYVYRNPYAAYPSVSVRGYYRSSGTYVAPHVRTAPNDTVTDNLSYRGFGTVRVPKSSLGSGLGSWSSDFSTPRTMPSFGTEFSPRPLRSSRLGY
ncbi:MAG TPA: hypothetical protein VN578_15485 [Candidatus Binatia bacterium]|jgi:hypothetical protein|nr:hypothetical protein [Candidatus Binatia bacterium]